MPSTPPVSRAPSTSPTPLPLRARAELFAQLATLENAGLPALQAFAMLELARAAQPRVAQAQAILAQRGDIALAGERSGLFTRLDARLIRAALNAGSPGRTYQRLAELYTQRAAQAATLKSRLMLPAFVLLVAVITAPLPGLVGGAIGMSGYLWKIGRPLLLIAALVLTGRAFQSQLPVLRGVRARRNRRDFLESLALMLEAGISMLDALPAALETVDDAAMRRALAAIAPRIAKGATLAQALAAVPNLRDGHLLAFVQTGESSGTLPEMLRRHSAIETAAIDGIVDQLATWVPRLIYLAVALWVAYGLISGPGIATVVDTR